jgi:glycosyltransferase involved in cell wall biosynthesis
VVANKRNFEDRMSIGKAEHPTISVVITNYNYRPYVARAVDSAVTQSVKPMEVVVVDDGSTDGSSEYVAEHYVACKPVHLITMENRGQLAAFREGLKHCTGDIICFLDADDHWDANYLELVQGAFEAQPSIDYVFTNMTYVGKRQGHSEKENKDRDFGVSALLTSFTSAYIGSPTSALSLKRNLLSRILDLPYEFDLEWKTCADTVIALGSSILGAHKYYLGTARANYHIHDANNWFQHSKGRIAELRHELRATRLTKYYRDRVGLDETALRWAQLEFKTRPNPRYHELGVYTWLLLSSRAPITYKAWAIASMLKHYFRSLKLR